MRNASPVRDGAVKSRPGPARRPDAIITCDLETFMQVAMGYSSHDEALRSGLIEVEGDLDAARRSVDILAPARLLEQVTGAGAG